MQPDSKVNLTRKESTRRGIELKDDRPPVVDLARQDSAKPSPPSKNRDPKEEDLKRSASHRDGRSRKYDRDERQEDDRYKHQDDQKRSDSRRHTSDQYQDDQKRSDSRRHTSDVNVLSWLKPYVSDDSCSDISSIKMTRNALIHGVTPQISIKVAVGINLTLTATEIKSTDQNTTPTRETIAKALMMITTGIETVDGMRGTAPLADALHVASTLQSSV
ncbi:hypothetical protein BYT27DRAFT_6375212 [Phlegmacium glaucopus]|nr:hypothetical protein BYT27DRAFT_6375212 [Phlegmacium glaucopus]